MDILFVWIKYSRLLRKALFTVVLGLIIDESIYAQDNTKFLYGQDSKLGMSFWTNAGNNFGNLSITRIDYISGIAGKYWASSTSAYSLALGGAISTATTQKYYIAVVYAQYEHHFFIPDSPISPYLATGIGMNWSLLENGTTNTSYSALRLLGLMGAEYKLFPNLSFAIQYGIGIFYGLGQTSSGSPLELSFGLGNTSIIFTIYF